MKNQDYPGTFIVIEGADGAGTTTQSKRLADKLDAHWTYEPSGNSIGEKVEELISSEEYTPEAVALAFASDRMVHLEEEVIPRLKDGQTVVCDRYYHSSFTYQPAMGLDFDWVKTLNKSALRPDKTFILDVSAEEGMKRVKDRGLDGDRFEELGFQQEVVARYLDLKGDLDEEVVIVDASQSKKEVFSDMIKSIE